MNFVTFTLIYLLVTVVPALFYLGNMWLEIQKYSTYLEEQDAE